MERLGYDRYVAQGGDWGADIAAQLGTTRPQRLAGDPSQHTVLHCRARDEGRPHTRRTEGNGQRATEQNTVFLSGDSEEFCF